jgi:PAS domain S-box-containing protein
VAVPASRLGSIAADLFEDLARTDEIAQACAAVLQRVCDELGITGAALLVRTGIEVRGAVLGLQPHEAAPLIRRLAQPESHLIRMLAEGAAPDVHEAGSFPPLEFTSFVAFTIPGLRPAPPFGVVVLEADRVDNACSSAAALLARVGPALGRVAQVEALNGYARRSASQRDLLTTIVNALPDPVLLTNEGNDIILANRRAEELFSGSDDDSDGRRRAIQVNNLLFSSFLTQSTITTGRGPSRELNLVDTQDGTDLLFEVLSAPLQMSGSQTGVISVLRDITDLRHAVGELEVQFNRSRVAEHEVRQERDRLNSILENVSDPILVTDDQTNIILLNPEADRLFVDTDDAADRRARRQILANDTRFTTLISNFLLRPERRQVERTTIVDPMRGADFPAEIVSSKILNARGEPVAIVSVVHDLTQAEENERLAQELQQLNDQLEDRIRRAILELEERNRQLEWQSFELKKASRLKSEFLANMSHELRTPINVILGYVSLLRERIFGQLTDKQDEALAKTYQTSQHLLELINDILDLSKIEAGKMPLHVEPVFVAEVVAEISESLLPMVRSKNLSYATDIDRGLDPVRTDRTKLKQVLLNLLSNAIKFTQEGSVAVAVAPLPERAGVRIVVSDTGIGIPAEQIDAIFEDFRQVDQSHTREYGGTGLGLSITKKLITLLGGSVAVESSHGVGTRFTISLPSVVEQRQQAQSAASDP